MHLGELLLARGLVTKSDIGIAVARQEKLGGRIGENLIAMGVITKRTLDAALREQYELAKAILAAEDLLAKAKRILGSDHSKANRLRCRLAVALIAGGRPEEALNIAQTALAGHEQELGGDHPWTKESAQAVADAVAAIERAASRCEEPVVPADDLDAMRGVTTVERADRMAPVGQVTTRFVGKPVHHDERIGPVRRIIGALGMHH
jgi:hypothetical protein